MSNDVKLARFGHHPDPAIDFCIEVESIESIMADKALGLRANEPWPAERVAKAMTFRVGADENCVVAKAALRKVEASLNQRHQPQREAVLEEAARFVEQRIGDTFLLAEELRALKTTPAPAVSRDDQALFNDICDKMAEVVAPLPGIPDAPGDAGTRAIEPSDGGEA